MSGLHQSVQTLVFNKEKGGAFAPFPKPLLKQDRNYFIASVISDVHAPTGSLVMIFWSKSAFAVRS